MPQETELTAEERLDRVERATVEMAERAFAALGRSGPARPALVALVADVNARKQAEEVVRRAVEEEERQAMLARVAERVAT